MSRSNKNFEAKKDILVQLALDLFIEKGYEQTTITDLQKAFNLTKGGMYHYFSSKEDILDAVIEQGLQQGMEELKTRMKDVPFEDQFIFFFFNSANNAFTQKLFQYTENKKSSIVAYKLREQTVAVSIPVLKEIIIEYIDAGIYQCDYPDEMTEFCALLAKAVSDTGLLPMVSISQRKGRVDALMYIWETCMRAPPEHIEQIRLNLYKVMEMQEEKQ